MANILADLMITSLDKITAYDITTGAFKFALEELQNTTIENAEEKTEITGKQGRKLNSMKRNKSATISGTNGILSSGLMELQTGGQFTNKKTTVKWIDYLTITSNAATTTWKATGTAGEEIGQLFIKNTDGTLGTQLTQAATAAAGKFAYDPSTKTLTFYSGAYDDGTEIAVFYDRTITADVLENVSDNYSAKCALYVDATAEDYCANVYHVQIYFPKADFDGNFSIEMGDNQAVHAFNAEALAGACGSAANFWTYTIFGGNTPDWTAST